MKNFPCDKCGACCRAVGCGLLTDTNRCSIYDRRPTICNVERGWKEHFSANMPIDEFIKMNVEACVELRKREEHERVS